MPFARWRALRHEGAFSCDNAAQKRALAGKQIGVSRAVSVAGAVLAESTNAARGEAGMCAEAMMGGMTPFPGMWKFITTKCWMTTAGKQRWCSRVQRDGPGGAGEGWGRRWRREKDLDML